MGFCRMIEHLLACVGLYSLERLVLILNAVLRVQVCLPVWWKAGAVRILEGHKNCVQACHTLTPAWCTHETAGVLSVALM